MTAWVHQILLNAVDITAKTVSGATVDEGENQSHVADFVYYPDAGPPDSDGLLLQQVLISIDVGAGPALIFNGWVIRAEWNQKDRNYRIRASNRLQEYFRALGSTAAVDAALPGSVYSEAVFGEPSDDLWEYAQRCMETLEQDVHLDRAGNLALIDWAAKGTPDITLDAKKIHNNGRFELVRPNADDVINQVFLEYGYRVSRWKTRKHSLSWSAWTNNTSINSWCTWAIGVTSRDGFPLPTLDAVESNVGGGSWNVPLGIDWQTHPPSGSNYCGVQGWVWIYPEGGERIVTQFTADGYRSIAQPITETYQLTINAASSQTLYGATVTDRRTGSSDIPYDPAWPPDTAQPPAQGWGQDAIGDYYEDQEDETRRGQDLQCGYQWAAQRIRGAHRRTKVIVRTDIDPAITLALTARVEAYGLTAKGKISRLQYVLDTATPYLAVTVALSRGNGGTTTPWAVPGRPDTTDPGYPAPPATTLHQTYVGFITGNLPDDPAWRGWVTNCEGLNQDLTAERYEPRFRVEWPELEDAMAEERVEDVPSAWEIAVPHDELILT